MWNTRGKANWTFVHIDLDEYWTPIPFRRSALGEALGRAMADTDSPPVGLSTKHLVVRSPELPATPLDVTEVRRGNDRTWGKTLYRSVTSPWDTRV